MSETTQPTAGDSGSGPAFGDSDLSGVGTDLVDLAKLGDWMDAQGLEPGEITGAEALPGGNQNLLLRFNRAGRTYVLRRGPRHLRRLSNDVMRREARVLRRVQVTEVPAGRARGQFVPLQERDRRAGARRPAPVVGQLLSGIVAAHHDPLTTGQGRRDVDQ